MKTLVPPAPIADFDAKSVENVVAAPKKAKVLDLAFLPSLYRTILVGGAILTACATPIWNDARAAFSFGGGFLLAALLLKGQELIFRQLAALVGGQKSAVGAIFLILAPLKLVLVLAFLYFLEARGLLITIPLGLGFFAGQLLIVARILGRFLSPKVRSVREVYIEGARSR